MTSTAPGADTPPCSDEDTFKNMLASFLLEPSGATSETCLISRLPLALQHVTLPCGHKFNYGALYAEVERQKYRAGNYETPRPRELQIRCPYCATIHDGLLPPCRGYARKARINSPMRWALGTGTCQHVFARGGKKGQMCGQASLCGETHCLRHTPRPEQGSA